MKLSEEIFGYGMSQRPVATSATGPQSPYKEWSIEAAKLEASKEAGWSKAYELLNRAENAIHLEATNAALLEALKIAKDSVQWMADAVDADPRDLVKLEIVNQAIRKATE